MEALKGKLIPLAAALVIAVAGFFTGSITDVGEAIDVALNKEKAIAECKALIEGEVQ